MPFYQIVRALKHQGRLVTLEAMGIVRMASIMAIWQNNKNKQHASGNMSSQIRPLRYSLFSKVFGNQGNGTRCPEQGRQLRLSTAASRASACVF